LEGKVLGWGEAVEVDGYVIKAEDFDEDKLAFVSISRDGEVLKKSPLSNGLAFDCEDEIKVYADEVKLNRKIIEKDGEKFETGKWDPSIKINVFLRGKPKIEINIKSDKESYDPKILADKDINTTITLKNVGKAKAEDLNVIIETGKLKLLEGKLKHDFSSVEKDETLKAINLHMEVPEPWEDTDYQLNVSVRGQDIKGKEFEWSESKTINIKQKWELKISKSASEERDLGETVSVSVNLRNAGICPLEGIKLRDFLPEKELELEEEVELEKTLSLKTGETLIDAISYKFIPKKPGDYIYPKAVASFTLPNGDEAKIESKEVKTSIRGPYVELDKKIDTQQLEVGEKLKVTLEAKNSGNVDVSVTLSDPLSPKTKFISGETEFKEVLKAGKAKTITYMLQMNNKGKILLPPAKATFLDLEDHSGVVYSKNPPPVYVGIPIEINSSSEDIEAEKVTRGEQKKAQPEKVEPSESKNKTETAQPTEEDAPDFGLILATLAVLGAVGLRKKRQL